MAGRKGEKNWRDAIMLAINEAREGDPEGRKNLYHIAAKTVEMALDGDIQAIKEIGDRIDGRAVQAIIGDPEAPIEHNHTIAPAAQLVLERINAIAERSGKTGEPDA